MVYRHSTDARKLCIDDIDRRVTRSSSEVKFNLEFTNITRVHKQTVISWNSNVECIANIQIQICLKPAIML